MIGIPLYPHDATDFGTNGVCLLLPVECTIEEEANGMYELTMTLPIESDMRFARVTPGCILKAAAPVRESPVYEQSAGTTIETTTVTVSREIYRVRTNGGRLRLRQQPNTSSKILGMYKPGVEVTKLADAGTGWFRVSVIGGGATGYMSTDWLQYARTVTETVTNSRPVTQNAIRVQISREQLFRVYSVENDTASGLQTVRAMHIFYDLRANFVNRAYDPANVSANTAVSNIMSWQLYSTDFNVGSTLQGKVTGEYGYMSPVEAFLDPDEGILAQTGGLLFRDNYDVWLLPDQVRDMGVTVRRGKNLLGVTVTTDDSSVVTCIKPCGKKKNGDPLFLDGIGVVDSPRSSEYSFAHAKKIDYDVQVTDDGDYRTEAAAKTELTNRANADFANGIDLPTYGMEVDFVMLGDAAGYEEYAGLQAVHLYDTVTVIDEMIGLTAKLRVTGYKWDVLSEQYETVTLGTLADLKQTTYSFNLADGSVTGQKVIASTIELSPGSVTFGHLSSGAVNGVVDAVGERLSGLTSGTSGDAVYAGLAAAILLAASDATGDPLSAALRAAIQALS